MREEGGKKEDVVVFVKCRWCVGGEQGTDGWFFLMWLFFFLRSEKGGKAGWRGDVGHLLLMDLFGCFPAIPTFRGLRVGKTGHY